MGFYAKAIVLNSQQNVFSTGRRITGTMGMAIFDEFTNQQINVPFNGDVFNGYNANTFVRYTETINGVSTVKTIQVSGTSVVLYTGLLQENSVAYPSGYYTSWTIISIINPPISDLKIYSITPTVETILGYKDGGVSVFATASNMPITYKIVETGQYNQIGTFTGLGAGNYSILVWDNLGISILQSFVVGLKNGGASDLKITNVVTANETATGANNGTVTITATSSFPTIQYSLNNSTWQTSNVFTELTHGNFTVYVKDANSGKQLSNFTIGLTTSPQSLVINNITSTPESTTGANNGTLTIFATSAGTIQYSLDNSVWVYTNYFTNLSNGNYTVYVKDSNGNLVNKPYKILLANDLIITNVATTKESRPGANDGSVTITATGTNQPLTYSLNGTTYQSSNVFNGLAYGYGTAYVKDSTGAVQNTAYYLGFKTNLTVQSITTVGESYINAKNGSLTINATASATPLTYSIDGKTYQNSNVFSGLRNGSGTYYVKDANGYIVSGAYNIALITVLGPDDLAIVSVVPTSENGSGSKDGMLVINATTSYPRLQYSLDNINWQYTNVFTGLGAGSGVARVKDGNGGFKTQAYTIGLNQGTKRKGQLPPLQFQLLVRGLKTYNLPQAPKGWDESIIEIKRDEKYYGLLNAFTIPLDFVLDGAWLLRTEFYTYGYNADVQLIVNELNPTTQSYDKVFQGKIDFSNVTDHGEIDGNKFTANVLANELQSLINAYEDTAVCIPLTDSNAITIQLPGIVLSENTSFNFSTQPDQRSNCWSIMTIIENKINSINETTQPVGFLQQDSPNFTNSTMYFMKSLVANNVVQINGNLSLSLHPNGAGSRYEINFYRSSDGSLVKKLGYDQGVGQGLNRTFDVTTQVNLTWNFIMNGQSGNPAPLALGEQLFLYIKNFDGNSNRGVQQQTGVMNVTYSTISPPSTVKALPAWYVFKYLINSIYAMRYTGSTYPSQSYLLSQAPWNQLCITSGDAFRPTLIDFKYYSQGDVLTAGRYYTVINGIGLTGGTVLYNGVTYNVGDSFVCKDVALSFTTSNGAMVEGGNDLPTIKTTFRDFFKSINSLLNVGFSIQNDVAIIEKKANFFNPDLPIVTFSDIQSIKIAPFTNYIYNSINCGYPDQSYDVLSGRKEINSEVQYSTPNAIVKNEYDIKSVYRADPYGIEFLRIQEGSNDSTKGDSEIFFIMRSANLVSGQTYYTIESSEAYPTITGTDLGYFNFSITPKKNLLRHGNFLAGALDKIKGQIILAKAQKSTSLTTVDTSGVSVSEGANVDISTLVSKTNPQLFVPYTATIVTDLPINILQLLNTYPTGVISFVVGGNTYSGFIISASIDPAKNKPREYKLLLTAKNILTNFIK